MNELFDTSEVISIDIQMAEEDWNTMLENAMSEEYYSCDVVINGTKLENVGIRPKGNTSLSAIATDSETDRYSLKLEFDHYVDGQTCFGLDKLILNNNYADATNMKEALVYDMYQYLGADASLYNEEYLEKYHAYLQQLVDEYVNGGGLDEFYERTESQIDSLDDAGTRSATTTGAVAEKTTDKTTFYNIVILGACFGIMIVVLIVMSRKKKKA